MRLAIAAGSPARTLSSALAAAAAVALTVPAASPAQSPTQRAQQLERVERAAQNARAASGMAAGGSAPTCDVPASLDVRAGHDTWIDAACTYDSADGRPTLRVTQLPAHGLIEAYTTFRSVHYTPDSGFQGGDSLKFVVSNNAGQSPEYAVALNVSATRNTAPECGYVGGALETSGDLVYGHALVRPGVARTLTSYCFDAEGDDITFRVKQAPVAGSLTNGAAEHGYPTLTYTAPADAAAATKFQAIVVPQDEHGLASGQEWPIGFEVTDANTAPDCGSSNESPDYWADVEQGDTELVHDAWCIDLEGDPVTLSVLSQPQNGTAAVTASGITITPSAGTGSGTFTYKGTDSLGLASLEGSASVNYVAPHSDPSCADKAVDVAAGTRTEFAVACTDADGDLIDAFAHSAAHGQLSLAGSGHVEIGDFAGGQLPLAYTPRGGFAGQDGFSVGSMDRYDFQATPAKVTLNVAGAGGTAGGGGSTPGGTTGPGATPEDPRAALTALLSSGAAQLLQRVSGANRKGIDARKAILVIGTLDSSVLPNGGTGRFDVYDKASGKKLARAAAAKRKLLGTTKVTLAKGQSKKVQVKLNKKGKALLKKRGKVKLTVDATLTDALTGAQAKQSRTYTFKVKKKRKRT